MGAEYSENIFSTRTGALYGDLTGIKHSNIDVTVFLVSNMWLSVSLTGTMFATV